MALNYQWERRQLIDMLREGKAQGGSGLSIKEKKIIANQKKVQDCILKDRDYVQKEVVTLIDNATITVYDGEKENRKRLKHDRIFHKNDANPPEVHQASGSNHIIF